MSAPLDLFQCQICGRRQDLSSKLGPHAAVNKGLRALRKNCRAANCPCEPAHLTGMQAILARTAADIVSKMPILDLVNPSRGFGKVAAQRAEVERLRAQGITMDEV